MSIIDLDISHESSSPGRRFFGLNTGSPGLILACLVMATVILWALFPGAFTQWSGTEGTAGAQRLSPYAGHWLGTDQLGRDVYARIVWGASHSLSSAFVAVALGLVVGTSLGLVAGVLTMPRVYGAPQQPLGVLRPRRRGPGFVGARR